MLHLGQLGRPTTVCGDDSIVQEVALESIAYTVGHRCIVITRYIVMETCTLLLQRLPIFDTLRIIYGLIHPVPDTSTNHARTALYLVPVVLQIADRLPHRVGILAHEVGFSAAAVEIVPKISIVGIFQTGVHIRAYIGVLVTPRTHTVFIVYGARTVERFAQIVGIGKVAVPFITTALIAQRPEYDARMVAVTLYHALRTVHIGILPCAVSGQALAGMTLHIGLVHTVQSIIVEHGIHLGLARIVAGTYHVDIGLLHHRHVFEHGLHIDASPVEGMGILRIDSLEEDTLAVYGHIVVVTAVDGGDVAESILGREDHLFGAGTIFLPHDDRVEIRVLSAPCREPRQFSRREGGSGRGSTYGDGLRLSGYYLACSVHQFHLHYLGGSLVITVVDGHRHIECIARSGIATQGGGGDMMVAHKCLGGSHQIHIAVYAREVPHVLSLQITAVTPAVDTHSNIVFALVYCCCDVKLGIGIGALRVTYVLPVYPNNGSTVHTVEVYHHTAVCPTLRKRKGTAIATHRIGIVGIFAACKLADIGWIHLKWIAHIHVNGLVVAVHFPTRGYRNIFPSAYIGIIAIEVGFARQRCRAIIGHIPEFPCPIQTHGHSLLRSYPRFVITGICLHKRCGSIGNVGGMRLLFEVTEHTLVLHPALLEARRNGSRTIYFFKDKGCGISNVVGDTRGASVDSQILVGTGSFITVLLIRVHPDIISTIAGTIQVYILIVIIRALVRPYQRCLISLVIAVNSQVKGFVRVGIEKYVSIRVPALCHTPLQTLVACFLCQHLDRTVVIVFFHSQYLGLVGIGLDIIGLSCLWLYGRLDTKRQEHTP